MLHLSNEYYRIFAFLTDDGLQTVSTNLNNFKGIKALPQSIMTLFPEDGDLYGTLAANMPGTTNSCRNK